MKKSICLGVLALILAVFPLFAQNGPNLSADDALRYINEKLKGIALVKNNKGNMRIDFYEKGEIIRTDVAPFSDLNADNVDYKPDEKAIVIKCATKDCIERRIKVPKSQGQFTRISIPGDFDPKTQKGLIHAFEHLLLLFNDPTYKSNKPFER